MTFTSLASALFDSECMISYICSDVNTTKYCIVTDILAVMLSVMFINWEFPLSYCK